MIWQTNNYLRYEEEKIHEEDLLASSGIFRIIHRLILRKISFKEALEQAAAFYEYRRDTAAGGGVRYIFFAAILKIIHRVDRLETWSRGFVNETIRQKTLAKISTFIRRDIRKTKNDLNYLGHITAVLPGVFRDFLREFFSSLKSNPQQSPQWRKKNTADSYTKLTWTDLMDSVRRFKDSFSSRQTGYFIFSLLTHLLVFYLLRFCHFKPRQKTIDHFEINAIHLVDAPPQARDKISTKGDEKQGLEKREKTGGKSGRPSIRKPPSTEIHTAQKEAPRPARIPDTEISPRETARLEPELRAKSITRAEIQPMGRQVAFSKDLPPQTRSGGSVVPPTVRVNKFRSRAVMRRKPISINRAAKVTSQQNSPSVAKSVGKATRQVAMLPRIASPNFSPNSQPSRILAGERKKTIAPSPGDTGFEKFIAARTVDLQQEKADLVRTHLDSDPREIRHSPKTTFHKAEISASNEKYDKDTGAPTATQGREGKILGGVKKRKSFLTGRAITLRTPIMRGGFTVGDVPNKSLEKESIPVNGPPRRAKMKAQKDIKYYAGRLGDRSLVSFVEEKVTYDARSREILTQAKINSGGLEQMKEEPDDLSKENRSSPVSELGSVSKRTLTPRENFSSSLSSQLFQGIEGEEKQAVQGKKFLAKAGIGDRNVGRAAMADKKIAFKTDKSAKLIFKKDITPKVTSAKSQLSPKKKIAKTEEIKIKLNTPPGNITRKPLYTLRGEIGSDVKQAFVTINDVTQMVTVKNGVFVAKIAMIKGINKINVLAFSSRGKIGNKGIKIFFRPKKAVPLIRILSPENGKQGLKEGDKILVRGTINNKFIKKAILYLNNIPIKIKVVNGKFQHKIFLPGGRINTFRVAASGKNGMIGYSPLHTILIGADFDINNPRPY